MQVRTKYFKTSCYHQEVLLHSPSTSAENCRQVYHVDVPLKRAKSRKKNKPWLLSAGTVRRSLSWRRLWSGWGTRRLCFTPRMPASAPPWARSEAWRLRWMTWRTSWPRWEFWAQGKVWLLAFIVFLLWLLFFKHRMSCSEYPLGFFFHHSLQ